MKALMLKKVNRTKALLYTKSNADNNDVSKQSFDI